MDAYLKNISVEEFNKLKVPILFEEGIFNRRFGVITNNKQSFGLAWRSDMIQPSLIELDLNIYGIGIDQNFAIVDFNNNLIRLKLSLTYNFYTIELFLSDIFIITELEIIRLNRVTFKVLDKYELPDLFEEMVLSHNDQLEVKCAGNISIVLDSFQ